MNKIFLIFLSGFSIGIVGSFHCVGMCGPLALSLPIHNLNHTDKVISVLLYNLGRAISYAIMGVVFGIIGQSFVLFNLQQALSIITGSFILVVLLANRFGIGQTNLISKFTLQIKRRLSYYLKSKKKTITYLGIGMLNGFLPCGLVYIAISAAILSGGALSGGLLMFAFGVGTLPLMALTMALGKFISLKFRNKINKLTPYMIMCVAILLIIRGLNLGIPYVSPTHTVNHVSCCHK